MKEEKTEIPPAVMNSQAFIDGKVLGDAVLGQQNRVQQVIYQNSIALESGLFTQNYSSLRNSNDGYI